MGVVYSIFQEAFPGKPQWSIDQVPDLSGQVVIVTGGNAGMSLELCKILLEKGAKVYMATRSRDRAVEAIEWLRVETGGKFATFLELDLADLASVRRAAEEFRRRERELHILYNHAGVILPPTELKSADGYDLQFGTSVLGHFLFTTLLLPVLIHTAQASPLTNGAARIVNTSSIIHWMAPREGIDYTTLVPHSSEADKACCKMGTTALYAQAKWATIVFSHELARRYSAQGIISVSLHPGLIFNRHNEAQPGIDGWLLRLMLNPTAWGTYAMLYGGVSEKAEVLSGKYLIPWGRVGVARSDTYDESLGRKLWSWLEEQVKLH